MAATDVIQPIVAELTKSLLESFRQDLDYLIRPNRYVRKMNLLVQSLVDDRNILQKAVDDALNLGKQIKPEVLRWLKSAGDVIARAELLLEGSNKRCFHGWCIDLGSRYNINKEAVEISDRIIEELQPTPGRTSVALPPPPPAVLSDPDFMEFESTKETMQQVIEALKDAECGVVGIFGMGGIGKTTIVKKIAQKVKKDKQFDQVAMAVVSQSPDLKKIQGQIASMLDLKFDQEADVLGRAGQLHERLMNLKSILLILDDVWAWLDLTKIGIPGFLEHNGCKVMLTTRREYVCTAMGRENGKKIKVGVLSKEESWELFKSNAGDGIDAPPLKEVAAMVMNECQCLPVALKTVGRALRDKDIGEWTCAKLQLGKSNTTNIEGMSKEVISCLRLSYDYLESDEMKACFLVCCLFTEDFDIPIEILVRHAVGKGWFRDASTIEEARTLTKTTLEKLKASCLLLEGENTYEECVKVHDVVRDVGLSIASEAKLLSRSGPGLGRWLQRNSLKHVKGACFATEEVVSLPEGIDCQEIEDLCIVAENNTDYSGAFFQTMIELKVLIHLGHSRLPTSLKCSVSLRTLHLVRCELGDISAALGELKMLEILTINWTDIESLPVEVGQLRNLRLLDLMANYSLNRIPGNVISQLSQLEELCITKSFDDWEIGEGRSGDVEKASLSELQSLPRLAILCVRVRDLSQFPSRFSLPNKLVKFKIRVGVIRYVGSLEQCPTSRKLILGLGGGGFQTEGVKSLLRMIDGYKGEVGNGSFKYKFTSEGSGSQYVLTDLAGGLNNLDSLSIEPVDWVSSLTNCATTDDNFVPVFENLQDLTLEYVHSLRGLASGGGIELEGTATATTRGGGVLPPGSLRNLKVLNIYGCDGLEGWIVPFSWTHRLHGLESVDIQACINVQGLFEVEERSNNNSTHNTPFRLLANLREIDLSGLPQLRSLTNRESSSIHFSNLRDVYIRECPSLVTVFTPNVLSQGLVHLEELAVYDCSGLMAIFEDSDSNSASSQETQTTSTTMFPYLKNVDVDHCPQLNSIFTVSQSQGLVHLEELRISNCPSLKVIFEESDTNSSSSQENRTSGTTTFPNLKTVIVQDCEQLKCLFTVSMAKGLPKLEVLELPYNSELEEIVCCNQNRAAAVAVKENKEINDAQSSSITWPQIRRIDIEHSRQFKRFCPRNCSIDVPLLQEFHQTKLHSDWMKNFAADPPAHGLNIPQSVKIVVTNDSEED